MLKLYDNCASLTFGRGNKTVLGMTSAEGESFEFKDPCVAEGAVETWMLGVEAEMRKDAAGHRQGGRLSLRQDGALAVDPEAARHDGAGGKPDLVDLGGDGRVRARVRAGNKLAMKQFGGKLTDQLMELTTMVRGDLNSLNRKKINQLIIIDVHARDIIDAFVRDSVLDAREFAWESQLRFMWSRKDDDIKINQCTGKFDFGYEYMGLNGLTRDHGAHRSVLHDHHHGADVHARRRSAGPRGDGKTETTKDLAKSMALLCVVFNCGEGWTTKPWAASSAGWCSAARGGASTSSTGSPWRCFRWCRRR